MVRWFKCKFWIPIRRRLKRQYLIDSTTLPSNKVIYDKMEEIDTLINKELINRNDRMADRLKGQKEILTWLINYER